ncbi:hypothetical protein [Chitinophaga alhagiae]|uniref:hypothetical protein n=1 Tax=Chitinophaga alhagiae TaxID=2203219 RepID=UPI0013006186|nr:hypothetical protein [Chitinophaga alhagiae]
MSDGKRFKDTKGPRGRLDVLFIGVGILSLFFIGIFTLAGKNVLHIEEWFNSKDFINYFISVVAGFIVSILATYFWEWYKVRRETTLVGYMQSMAPANLLNIFVKDLEFYRKRHLENYKITTYIHKTDKPGFFRIRKEISYFKSLQHKNTLDIEFFRITNEKEREEGNNRNRNFSFVDHEFGYTFDETDFEHSNLTNEDYVLENAEVRLNRRPLKMKRSEFNHCVRYTADVPIKLRPLSEFVEVSFVVEYYLEKDSYMNFIFDLPVKGMTSELIYTEVSDEIFIGGAYYLSSDREHPPFDRGENDKLYLTHDGWILPKSSLVYIWWKRNKPA